MLFDPCIMRDMILWMRILFLFKNLLLLFVTIKINHSLLLSILKFLRNFFVYAYFFHSSPYTNRCSNKYKNSYSNWYTNDDIFYTIRLNILSFKLNFYLSENQNLKDSKLLLIVISLVISNVFLISSSFISNPLLLVCSLIPSVI